MDKQFNSSFQISLSFSTIAISAVVFFGLLFTVFRYTYLNRYSKNTKPQPEVPTTSNNIKNLGLVDNKKRSQKRSSTNYLDQFLSAIKVFGYLEPAVFHELTKSMTTQKLSADEILYLDENLGFSIVVDGILQIYTKCSNLGNDYNSNDISYEKDDVLILGDQRYQLLNEVKPGSSLSSFISTLDLFKSPNIKPPKFAPSEFPSSDKPNGLSSAEVSQSPKSPDSETPVNPQYPEVVARAKANPYKMYDTVSATIAIIPHSAFQRVHAKFPQATSHIVTMVLNRLYKVTVSTIHDYLGLTKEIFDTEIQLNQNVKHLPGYLHEGVMEKINNSSENLDDNIFPPLKPTKLRAPLTRDQSSRYVLLESRSKATFSGDLLSSVPISRRADSEQFQRKASVVSIGSNASNEINDNFTSKGSSLRLEDIRNGFSNDLEETEDQTLRLAIVENIFTLIGIDDRNYGPNNISSQMSSRNSSMTAFVTDDAFPGFGPFLNSTSYQSTKLYTVSSQSNGKESTPLSRLGSSEYLAANQQSHRKSSISSLTKDFNSIKCEFSNSVHIRYFGPDTTIVKQGSFRSGLYYVINGQLDIVHEKLNEKLGKKSLKQTSKIYSVGPGGLAGYLSSVIGFRSLVSIRTSPSEGAVVAHIPKEEYSKLMDRYYFLQLPVAIKLKSLLSKQILTIDYALEWCRIPAGQFLCSQGDMANGFHVVLSGRFRVIRNLSEKKFDEDDEEEGEEENDDNLIDESTTYKPNQLNEKIEVIGEYGHGASIGEVEVLTASRRTTSLVAVRDSETARIPRTLFELLSTQNPSIMVKVSRIVAEKVLSNSNTHILPTNKFSSTTASTFCDYKTITILPTVGGLPVRQFADKLVSAFGEIGRKVIALDQASTLKHLGRHAFDDRLSQLKLSGYFAYLEEEYDTIVYVCDSSLKSNWTSTCISQGDCILLLADAEDESVAVGFGDYERLLVNLKTTARTDLILLHSDKNVLPGSTSLWLKNRLWVQGHHHIAMEVPRSQGEKLKLRRNRSVFQELAEKLNKNSPFEVVKMKTISSFVKLNQSFMRRSQLVDTTQPHKNDFLRLARLLSNEAVGLVLGGGGARGISHVGVVMALERHGIPVDIIGGTSIGSLVGGLYAKDYNTVTIYGRAKQFSKRISALWRLALDLTYPVTSYITGYEFNRGIWKIFGNYEIEDFWLQYFCNSTNITNSTMDIHETGFSWRFIRASMSLAGLLPPIAYNGCMLLDGGYLDNLPVQEMKKKGAKYIIAVDVGSIDDRTPQNYGDTLSGFWVVLNRWNPFSKHPNVPNMMDIQMRLAYVASVNALEEAKKTPGVIYMRPPIDDYATLDFGKFDEIYHIGLSYAENLLDKWDSEGKLPNVAGMKSRSELRDVDPKLIPVRRNSV